MRLDAIANTSSGLRETVYESSEPLFMELKRGEGQLTNFPIYI